MATTQTVEHTYTGNGTTTSFTNAIDYYNTNDIKVTLDGVLQPTSAYTVTTNSVTFTTAPTSGQAIRIYRDTDVDAARFVFSDGSTIFASHLNKNFEQLLDADQELVQTENIANSAVTTDKITDDAVTAAKLADDMPASILADGSITNQQISSSAAIEGTKVQAASSSNPGTMSASDFVKLNNLPTAANLYEDADVDDLLNTGDASSTDVLSWNGTEYEWVPGGSGGSLPTIAIGYTTTAPPLGLASVTNSGTNTAAVLEFTIPRGANGTNGTDGTDGIDGTAATISVGTVTTGAAGTSATVTNSGTSNAAVLDFAIPRGADGPATVSIGTVTTGAAGSSATVTNSGTSSAATLDFTIPRGDTGATGATGADGADGSGVPTGGTAGQVIEKIDGTDYNVQWVTPVALDTAQTYTAEQTFSDGIAVDGGFTTPKKNQVIGSIDDIDVSSGNYFYKARSSSTTITFSGSPSNGNVTAFTVELALTGTNTTITWPNNVYWNDGDGNQTAPQLTDNRTHLFMFVTSDNGTTYRGSVLKDYTA